MAVVSRQLRKEKKKTDGPLASSAKLPGVVCEASRRLLQKRGRRRRPPRPPSAGSRSDISLRYHNFPRTPARHGKYKQRRQWLQARFCGREEAPDGNVTHYRSYTPGPFFFFCFLSLCFFFTFHVFTSLVVLYVFGKVPLLYCLFPLSTCAV